MTNPQPDTDAALENLAFRLRSNPPWMREQIIREFLIPPETLQAIHTLIADAMANVDQRTVDLLNRTVEPLK